VRHLVLQGNLRQQTVSGAKLSNLDARQLIKGVKIKKFTRLENLLTRIVEAAGWIINPLSSMK
jgi:hypothetical protein